MQLRRAGRPIRPAPQWAVDVRAPEVAPGCSSPGIPCTPAEIAVIRLPFGTLGSLSATGRSPMEPASIDSPKTRHPSYRLAGEPRAGRERAGSRDPRSSRKSLTTSTPSPPAPQGSARRRRVHQVSPEAGRLRPAPARRADGARQAADGRRHARPARRLRRRDREARAPAQGPRHDPPEHPDAPHPRCRTRPS